MLSLSVSSVAGPNAPVGTDDAANQCHDSDTCTSWFILKVQPKCDVIALGSGFVV